MSGESQQISTGQDTVVPVSATIPPLSELKDLFGEIKRVMDANKEQGAPIETFKGIISALSQNLISQPRAAAATDEQTDSEAAEVEDPVTNYLYDELIPGTASRLAKHGKSTNTAFTTIVGEAMIVLVDLLSLEVRLQTKTCCRLVAACRPLFDMAQAFFFHHHQKQMAPMQTGATHGSTGNMSQQKADVGSFTAEDIEWRNNLMESDCIDVVKHDLSLSIEGWSRGEITSILGGVENGKNLGDESGNNVKRFSVKYFKDAAAGTKIFRADSTQIAPYDTKTKDDEWRYALKVADQVDVMDNYGAWSTCTVIKKESELNNPLPLITVGFRRYSAMGDKLDDLGAYFGKDSNFDQQLALYSVRVQKAFTCANNADPNNQIVWKFQAPSTMQTHKPNIGSVPGGNPPVSGSSQMISTTEATVPSTKVKTPDEIDMEMITEEGQKIFATERYSCKSSFLVKLINRFGEADGYENLLKLVAKPELSLEYVHHLVCFFVKSHSMLHKQFVDAFYERLSSAVETRLLSLTNDQLRTTKLDRIEDIISQIWQTMLLRKMTFVELQVVKSQLQVKIGILFMKQTFLQKRIDGAKMIDAICKTVVNEAVSQNNSASAKSKQNLLQLLVDTLNEANVLDLFFSSQNIHSQLVQRSDGLIKVLLKSKALSQEDLEKIWVNCQSHESMALDLSNVLKKVAFAMEPSEIIFFSTKILAKPPVTVKSQEVDLMLSMGRRTGVTSEELKQNQGLVVKFFWNYLFDAAAENYLDLGLAKQALESFSELLRLTSKELIMDYFTRLVHMIRDGHDKSFFCVLIAQHFFALFYSKDEMTKEVMIQMLQTEHQFLDLLIDDLAAYMAKVKENTENLTSLLQVNKNVFSDLYPHSEQLEKRVQFIQAITVAGKITISKDQIARVWNCVITENRIVEDHSIVANWLLKTCDDFMLGRDNDNFKYDDLLDFFQDTIGAESNSFVTLTLQAYYCIQGFFILFNLKSDFLVVLDDDVARIISGCGVAQWEELAIKNKKIAPDLVQVCAKVAPNEMVGIRVLWKIAIDCQEAQVGTGVTSMLLQVHTNVDFGLEEKVTSYEDQFIESCMSIIMSQKKAIEGREPELLNHLNRQYEEVYKGIATSKKIRKVMPVEEKRIIACLSYLKMLVLNSEKDGMNNLIPHTALHTGTFLGNITVNNAYTNMNLNGHRNRFTVQMYSNATIYQLKQCICNELAWRHDAKENTWVQVPIPHPWTVRITKFSGQTPIRDSDNGKTLAEAGFGPNEVLSVYKKGNQSESKMPLITLGNQLNDRAKYLFTEIFNRYAAPHPEDETKKVMMFDQMTLFVQHATGEKIVQSGVYEILKWAKQEQGKMHLEEFLTFYQDCVEKRLQSIRKNLANMGYRDDLKIMPPPGSPDNILQARKTFNEMPRFKISQNEQVFNVIIGLFELQSEVSKEAQSLVKMICTNQKIFWNILKLDERQEGEGEFSWDMVFSDEIKVTMYSLDIIDSIIKNVAYAGYTHESNLRVNWVERFLSKGGFSQLIAQLKRALSLAKDSLINVDFSSEKSNLTKKFIDSMLKIMKTFIFAAIYADKGKEEEGDFLVLKRQSSKVDKTDAQKAQEAEEAKQKELQIKRTKMEEDQFGQAGSTSSTSTQILTSVGGETVPWAGASHGPTTDPQNRVYGPQPPPGMGTQVRDDDLERALKASEDPRNQVVPSASEQQQSGEKSDDFEHTPRFKQIVEQIRESKLTATLMRDINFNELQNELLDILAIFLSNRSDHSKEESNIISSALSLWSAAIVQKPELINDFFSWSRTDSEAATAAAEGGQIMDARDFLLHGIYSPKSFIVREQFKEKIELICEKIVRHPLVEQSPLDFVLKVLKDNFPSTGSAFDTHNCSDYFTLFGALIKQYQENQNQQQADQQPADSSVSIFDLLKESIFRLRDHPSSERDSSSSPDSTLVGLLVLVKELLDSYIQQTEKTEYERLIEFTKRNHLLHEFFYENLYFMPERTTNPQNKCKTNQSRTAAYKLLYKLMKAFKPKEMAEFLEDYLWPMIKDHSRPTAWRHQPSEKQRSTVHKQAGIHNLGNICYMISMLQQFYMVPQFRYQLLKAIDSSPEDIKTYKERKVDDNLLRQFQRLFGFLELSERAFVDPFDFCFAYKDLSGEPTNVAVQYDSQEFLTFFFDRIEDVLRGTSQKYLLQDMFRGTYVEQKVCQSCGKTKNDISMAYTLSVQVENTKDLYQSLNKVINGEIIQDFQCDGCNQKVNITKRQLLGSMPNVLIVHLQRIVFDFNTFGNKKVNSQFEFPRILETARYSFKEQMKGNADNVQGESDQTTAELNRLLHAEDEEYVYRLVGVNIHRGVADSGHYWSMINTKRGKDEPDPAQNEAEWRSSIDSDWKKFDDESVSFYNLADLEKDSFGGNLSALTDDEKYISNTAGGSWGKSAYMLIYEKKLKQPIREVNLEQSSADTEKIQHVGCRDVEPYIPEWLRSMVQKDNTDFVIDRQVFNTQFFKLVMLVLKHISADLSMTQHQYPLEYIENFTKMHQVAVKIGHKVMFDFLSHYHENSCIQNINDYVSTIFTFGDSFVSFVRKAKEPSIICEWIEQTLLDDQCTYFFHLMFNCPDKTARLYCGKIVASTVNKGFRILQVCESKEEEKDHPKVKRLRDALDGFMKLSLDVIHTRECQKNWTRLEQFFMMLQDIITGGKPQAEYLLKAPGEQLVVKLIDLMLQDKSPRAKNEPEPRVEMGGTVAKAAFGPLIISVCHLVTCMYTQTNQDCEKVKTFKMFEAYLDKTIPPSQVDLKVVLTGEALELLTNSDFINLVMSGESQESEPIASAFAHICFGNKKLTKEICTAALKAINVSDYTRISSFLKVVKAQIEIDDGLRQQRLEWIFGFPFLNTGLQQGEVHKIGLDSLHHEIKGEVFTFKSMLTYDPVNNCSLLQLLWRHQGRMEDFTMTCLDCLADIVTSSEEVMEFFSNLPGVTYQYARYSDWIQPFLTSHLNKVAASTAVYQAISKEDIIKVMSKFELYDNYTHKKDQDAELKDTSNEDEENKNGANGDSAEPKFTIKTLKSTPPAYIICKCTDENYLNVVEHEGVMLSLSYLKGSYVMSRPTGYTNLAVSAAFLASGGVKIDVKVPPLANPIVDQTSSASANKSANAMLAELDNQKQGSGAPSSAYAAQGSAPLRVKQVNSSTSSPLREDPPKIIVDSNDEWEAVRAEDGQFDANTVYDYTQASTGSQPQQTGEESQRMPQEEESIAPEDETKASSLAINLNESFDNWTGDEMHACDDLVYKLTLSNTTDKPILFKISFKEQLNDAENEAVNLNYPITGIKGSLAANEMSNICALLTRKVQPGASYESGRFELEKVEAVLKWKFDVEKIARMAPAENDAANQASGASTQTANGAERSLNDFGAYQQDDFYDAGPSSSEKQCQACTSFNAMTASACWVCTTPFN